MDFENWWINWMWACVSSNLFSFLVNGSLSKEFQAKRGLCQGDPLSHFLYLIAIEGLATLMHNVVLDYFHSSILSNDLSFNLLQFTDDTILLWNASWDSLWELKSVLSGFEVATYFLVNFHTRKVISINVHTNFVTGYLCFHVLRHYRFPVHLLWDSSWHQPL